MKFLRLPVILMLAICSVAQACNIPVFRYALERWAPDACQVFVFHQGALSSEDSAVLAQLTQSSLAGHAVANFKLTVADIRHSLDADVQDVWLSLKASLPDAEQNQLTSPLVIARSSVGRGKMVTHWKGSLTTLSEGEILRSPARTELIKRLQSGHAIVWLILKSPHEERNAAAKGLLQAQLAKLSTSVELPEGIGLPGSELYSEVPLLLKFSVLEIDPHDHEEQFLVHLLSGFHPESFAAGQPMIIPVFGRGRALEVIPAGNLNAGLIEDLTVFLCGACSCQVKELNPGFDLLLTSDWNTALFGAGAAGPPDRQEGGNRSQKPVLLPIPPGRQR